MSQVLERTSTSSGSSPGNGFRPSHRRFSFRLRVLLLLVLIVVSATFFLTFAVKSKPITSLTDDELLSAARQYITKRTLCGETIVIHSNGSFLYYTTADILQELGERRIRFPGACIQIPHDSLKYRYDAGSSYYPLRSLSDVKCSFLSYDKDRGLVQLWCGEKDKDISESLCKYLDSAGNEIYWIQLSPGIHVDITANILAK